MKKKSFRCGVKIRVVNLDGDWELRGLSGRGKPRDEPGQARPCGLEVGLWSVPV